MLNFGQLLFSANSLSPSVDSLNIFHAPFFRRTARVQFGSIVAYAIQPFVDTSHPAQDFFLPRKYAIAIPTVLVIFLVAIVATFVGLTLMKSARKPKQKAS